MIIKILVESQIVKTGYGLKVQMPILFNIPIYSKLKYLNEVLKITSCEEVIFLFLISLSGIYTPSMKKQTTQYLKTILVSTTEYTITQLMVY